MIIIFVHNYLYYSAEHILMDQKNSFNTMNQQQNHRLSIKDRLKHKDYKSSTNCFTATQVNCKIYTPQYYNYFLNTIDKEIKHEGNLLKRIKRKIQHFKDKQEQKKRIKNSKHYHSHLMFSSSSVRKDQAHHHTPNQSAYIVQMHQLNKKYFKSAVPSARETNKVKTSSFAASNRLKTANQKRQSIQLHINTFNHSHTSNFKENQLFQKFKKQSKINKDLSVMGGQPQWKNFQSYRNNSTYMLKKRY